MSDLSEDDQPHEVEGPEWAPICGRCGRAVHYGDPVDRWQHSEPQYDAEYR